MAAVTAISGRFCGSGNVHDLAVFEQDYGVVLFLLSHRMSQKP